MLDLEFGSFNVFQLKIIAAFCIVSILMALICFDIRKLHLRTAGAASFAMVFAYIKILCNLTVPFASISMLLLATSIPALIMLISIRSIQSLRARC
jgi:cytochrome c biogenesis factor